MALNYAKTDEAKRLISTVAPRARRDRATLRAAAEHADRPCADLRKAFMDTMKDPDFLRQAKKANLDINPADGAELEQSVKEILKIEPGLVAKLKEILK